MCSDRVPCDYGEGNCHDDSECQSEYICGVNNCGALVPGKAGSCCVIVRESLLSPEVLTETRPAEWSSWGPWSPGSGRVRGRVFWPGEDCEGCDTQLEVNHSDQITNKPPVRVDPKRGLWSDWGAWVQSRQGWGRVRGRVFWPTDCQDCQVTLQVEEQVLD